jgi:hypothetical protein
MCMRGDAMTAQWQSHMDASISMAACCNLGRGMHGLQCAAMLHDEVATDLALLHRSDAWWQRGLLMAWHRP